MSTLRVDRVEDREGNPLWSSEEGVLGNVTTSTGTQTVVDALNNRQVKTYISPKEFGYIEGEDARDALIGAISDGRPVDFGNSTYEISSPIYLEVPHSLIWKSSGSEVVYTGGVAGNELVAIDVQAGVHTLEGRLTFNAQNSSPCGLRISRNGSEKASIFASKICAKNIRRALPTDNYGDGILFRGSINALFSNCEVDSVVMAAGAGVPGVVGVSGISVVSTASDRQPGIVRFEGGKISEIRSEDLDYTLDQDGIRVVVDTGAVSRDPSLVIVQGGLEFHNCYGRSVKSQSENTIIQNVSVKRDAGLARGYGNPEFDFQEGGGRLRDVSLHYVGTMPLYIALFSSTRAATKTTVPYCSVSGIQAALEGTPSTEYLFRNENYSTVMGQIVKASDIEIIGDSSYNHLWQFGGPGDAGLESHLMLDDITAAPLSGEWVQCPEQAGEGTIIGSKLIHTGPTPGYIRRSNFPVWRPQVDTEKTINFVEAIDGQNGTSLVGSVSRTNFLADKSEFAGGFKVYSVRIAAGATVTIPNFGANELSGLINVSGIRSELCGILGRGGSGGVVKFAGGAQLEAGGLTNPGTGLVRVWQDGNDLRVQSNEVSARDFIFTILA